MRRVIATFGGVVVLAVIAGLLTEATLVWGQHGKLSDDTLLRTPALSPSPGALPSPSTTPAPTPTPTPVSNPTPTPAPVATPSGPTAVTNGFVRLRAGKSTATAILAELNGGVRVQLLSDSNAQWQQVRYNGIVGYIFKTYLTY